FGDTAALMLTVASPKATDAEIEVRAHAVQHAIEEARQAAVTGLRPRVALVQNLPQSVPMDLVHRPVQLLADASTADGLFDDVKVLEGAGFVGVDAASDADDAKIEEYLARFIQERLRASEFHPDSWPAVLIRDPDETRDRLVAAAGDKYTYR